MKHYLYATLLLAFTATSCSASKPGATLQPLTPVIKTSAAMASVKAPVVPVEISKNGKALMPIVISNKASDKTKELAQTLTDYLQKISGGSFKPSAAQTSGHYWGRFIHEHQKEFDADPSMYALMRLPDGQLVRKGPQLESTNPKVVDMMVEDIKNTFTKNNWPHDKAVGFPSGGSLMAVTFPFPQRRN